MILVMRLVPKSKLFVFNEDKSKPMTYAKLKGAAIYPVSTPLINYQKSRYA
jgi:hypothetical protein